MADAPKQLISVQGIDEGVEASVNHSPEVHELIDKAKQELANWLPQWGEKPVSTSQTQEVAHELREKNLELVRDYIPPEHLFDEKTRSEEHTSELQSRENLVCRLLLEK